MSAANGAKKAAPGAGVNARLRKVEEQLAQLQKVVAAVLARSAMPELQSQIETALINGTPPPAPAVTVTPPTAPPG